MPYTSALPSTIGSVDIRLRSGGQSLRYSPNSRHVPPIMPMPMSIVCWMMTMMIAGMTNVP